MNRSHSRDLDRKRRLSGVLENLPSNVRKRVELLREVHAQRCEVEAKLKEGIEALEAKYQKLYQPLYTKRYEIVNEISEDEGNEAAMEKGIPGFWLFVLKNNGDLFDLIRRRDGDALKFLKDIKHSPIDEPRGFKIAFFFGANPYFKNSVLTKTYHMNVGDGAVPERAIGTEIDWYPGKSFTQKILKKKNPNTVPKNEKPMDEPIPCRSFFNFFNPPHFPLYKHESDEGEYDEDRIYEDDINEDDIDEKFQELDDDYKIGSTIRDKIIPNAVSWFTTEMDEDYIGMVDVDEFYYDDEEIVFDY